MRSSLIKAFTLALLLVGLNTRVDAGYILRIFYDGISGGTVADLTGAPSFPNGPNPDGSPLQGEYLTEYFEGLPSGGDGASDYGSWIRGYIEAPDSGDYTFWIASDDASELWLSTDTSAANKKKIAYVTSWSGSREWTKEANQKSAAVKLTRGQKYYVEVLHKEGGGGDNLAVGWQRPSGTQERPIPGLYLQAYPDPTLTDPSFVKQPKSVTATEGATVNLFANVNASQPASFQWLRNGMLLPGAVLSSYSFKATMADNGSVFNLIVGNGRAILVSDPATVTVQPDTAPATLVSASATMLNPHLLTVKFSEPVEEASALNAGNYFLDNGATVSSVAKGADALTFVLTTSELSIDPTYTLTAVGVKDLAATPNLSNSSKAFKLAMQFQFKVINSTSGTGTNDILSNAKYKAGSFDRFVWVDQLRVPWNFGENYLGWLEAFVIPPVTGAYNFYIYADDACMLYLSTDDNPANKKVIANNSNSWTDEFQYDKFATQKSAAINLVAGQRYYIEAVFIEGGGGDGVGVAWQKPGDPAPVNGKSDALIPGQNLAYFGVLGPVAFTTLPETINAPEGGSATFTAKAEGTPPISYQWYRNGAAVAGATSYSFTISGLTPANGADKVYVVASNLFSSAQSPQVGLNVVMDVDPPVVTGVGSLTTNLVNVVFNEPVNIADAGAMLTRADGAAVDLKGVSMLNPTTVLLNTGDLVSQIEYILGITGVKDLSSGANLMADTNVVFEPFNFEQTVRINNSQDYSGLAYGDRIEIVGGGADIWGTADQFVYTYTKATGDFDYVVRLESVAASDTWAKAGLMARSTLDAGSRHIINAGCPETGMNLITTQYRPTTGGDSAAGATVSPPNFSWPNAWLRLQRIGSVFYSYYSKDGVEWVQYNKLDSASSAEGAMPATLHVGLAVTSHTTSKTTKAVFTDFGIPPEIPFSMTAQPQSVTALQGNKATFSVGVKGTPPFTFQWQRNGVNISGATSASYTTPNLTYTNDNGAVYRCLVTSIKNGTVTTSSEATLTVPSDIAAPTIVSVTSGPTFDKVTITFSEVMDPATALNLANYTVDGGLTLESVVQDGAKIVFATSPQTSGTKYNMTINGLKDPVGYPLPANTKVSFTAWVFMQGLVVFEVFEDIGGGTTIADLTNNVKYINNTPDKVYAYGNFETPTWENGSNYGGRMKTILTPPLTADYIFYIASDDASVLYLSSDSNPANKGATPIARVDSWTNQREWTKSKEQRSTPSGIRLEAGKQYYLEALNKEGGGGDGIAVAAVVGNITAQGDNPLNETAPKAFDKNVSTKWLDFANIALVKINFQNSTSEGYPGYLPDNGEAFGDRGNGFSYGWNKDNTANARNRNQTDKAKAPDERYDTFNHMMKPEGPWFWEIEVPNGFYSVHIVGGDPNNWDTTNKINVESTLVVDGVCATNKLFVEGTKTVQVTDGKLTVAPAEAAGAYNAKIAFLEIIPTKRSSWIQYKYADGVARTVVQYNIGSANDHHDRDPMDWTFYGVKEDGSLDLLDTQTGQAFAAFKTIYNYPINNTQAYFGYRLVISSVADPSAANSVQLSEIELIDATGANTTEAIITPSGAISSQYTGYWVNPDKSFVTITQQPKAVTTLANRTATFTVVATGGSEYSSTPNYQWQKDGVDIPGATGPSYTTPMLTVADSGAKYRCVMTVPALTKSSDEVTLTVEADTVPPVVTGAAGLVGSWQINVFFDELVDPESATNIVNYGVLGGLVSDARMARDGRTVLLTVEWLAGDTAEVWVNDVKDISGNAMAAAATVTAPLSQLTARDVGTQDPETYQFTNPLERGQTIALNTKDFDVIAGGTDIWDNADGFHFVYERKTGDFDVAVQVARLDIANNWSKAGLMAREKITAGSRNINLVVDPAGTIPAPDGSGTGANVYEPNYRAEENGASSTWPGASASSGVPYPNAWLRLQRVGDTFVAYRGNNGTDWTQIAMATIDYPDDVYLGLAFTAHNNAEGQTGYAQFRNYQAIPKAPLAIGTQPANATALQGQTVIFTAVASGSMPYFYQWMRNGTAISGATSATFTTPTLTYAADNGAKYSCVISNLTGAKVTTRDAVLTIDPDFVKPTVVSVVGSGAMNEIKVAFSEAVNQASATALANYTVTGGLTISGATLSSSKSNVVLKTSAQTPAASYSLTIKNVTDVPGNAIDPTTKSFSGWVFSKGFLISETYANIGGGTAIADLTNSAPFVAGTPTSVAAVTGVFETPSNAADNYGLKVHGLLMPPVSGNYTFYIATDDAGSLYLSSDDKAANKGAAPIAYISGWAGSREWNRSGETGQKSAAINLVAGKSYYVEVLMKEGGGGDNLAVAWRLPGEATTIANGASPIPGEYFGVYANPDGASVTITTQPANVSADQSMPATFTVAATGTSSLGSTVAYQWQRDGVDIPGANGASYTVAATAMSDNGAKFRCVVTVPAKSATSAEATLTVIPDTAAPTVASAAGLLGNGEVYVYFNEKVDSVTASTASNYGVSGGVVTDAMLATDGKSVVLSVSGLSGATVSVAANRIQDLAGNAMSAVQIVTAPVSQLTAQDVGTQDADFQFTNPLEPGATWVRNASDYDIVAGGTDIWDNSDGFRFTYEKRTGDFDVVVQVARLDIANNWSKAGLMAREELTGDSRNVNLVVDPSGTVQAPDGSGTGANVYEPNFRATKGGSSSTWTGSSASSGVPYPNAWMRLTRAGDVFTAYRGTNGVAWTQFAKMTNALPSTLYVGMALTAHNNGAGQTTFAEFRNYKISP